MPLLNTVNQIERVSFVANTMSHFMTHKIVLFVALVALPVLLTVYYVPALLLLFVLINFLLVSSESFIQVVGCLLPRSIPLLGKRGSEAFVSIHIPTYNEPAYLVKNTLRALSKLDYKNFEVIVIDNNTKDKANWKPICAYCKRLGRKFKFFHVEHLEGYKAGALNYIQKKVDKKTQFTAVIDADYEVKPNFIREALRYFTNDNIALVQFPQAYKNVYSHNQGIRLEYEYFFRIYMNMANYFDCATSTGTLAIYRISALKKVHMFNKNCITEDADIGVRLLRAGYKTIYVPKIVGRGLMPFDIEAYKKQKARWSLGNAQILQDQWMQIIRDRNFTFLQKIGLISQLTAWINFTFFAATVLIMGAVMEMFIPANPIRSMALEIASATMYVFVFFKLCTFILGLQRNVSITNIGRGFFVHLGMGFGYSTVLMHSLFKKKNIFERTNKFIHPKIPHVLRNTIKETLLGSLNLIMGVILFIKGDFSLAGALFLVSIMYFLVYYVYVEMKQTRQFSKKLLTKMELSLYGN